METLVERGCTVGRITEINFSLMKLSELPVSRSAVKVCRPLILMDTVASFPKVEESQVARIVEIVEKDCAADATA